MRTLTEQPATTTTVRPANRAVEQTATTVLRCPTLKRLLDCKPAAPTDIPQVSLDDAIRQRFSQIGEKTGVNSGSRGFGDDRSMREARATRPGAPLGPLGRVLVGLTKTESQSLEETPIALSRLISDGPAISHDEADRRDRQFVEMYTCSGASRHPSPEVMSP